MMLPRLLALAAAFAVLTLASIPARALCKPTMMDVEGMFCIDQYEAELVEVRGAKVVPWSPYYVPLATSTYKAVNGRGIIPQGYISGEQAQAACRNAGKRLCTSTEWLKACEGPANTIFPYGKSYRPEACNEHGHDPKHVGPLQRLQKGKTEYDLKTMNDPRINQLDDSVAPSGSYEGCASPYGVYDLVGNLHEWIVDKSAKGTGVFKGGYFNDADKNGPGCTYTTTAHEFTYHDYSTGFRCCADPITAPAFEH
jgi:formylglycine-generating enzyme required for sulfatase activity